ncbi:IclR family transcriptional regulator [Streptomyces sp. NPDC050504]|uniref:IclR family transcriptional regulator n=1 Tax=Streptomyces sp. NPDC050504 TaxID=3365618 RepID=UPI0037BA5BD9
MTIRDTTAERGGDAPLGGTGLAERVFRVQQAFTRLDGDVHGPGELARATGLDDSTVHRILRSGLRQGMFVRLGHGRYSLGAAVVQLAIHACSHRQDPHLVHAVLEELRVAAGGPVFFYALAPFGTTRRLCVDMAVTESDLRDIGYAADDILSVARPLRSGACGRAILAFLPLSAQRGALDVALPSYAGPGALTDWDALRASLDETRRYRYAVGKDEDLPGWNSCAAPVLWGEAVLGSVLVLRRAAEMPVMAPVVIRETQRAAAELALLFGGQGPGPAWPDGTW